MLTGELVDTSGFLAPGRADFDHRGNLSDAYLARVLVKALKAHHKLHPEHRQSVAHDIKQLRNPKTVKEALSSPQLQEWIRAINAEMQSLAEKGVYEIKKLPRGRKAIPTRLVLKIKLNADGSIDKFKARCVVAGYRQQAGLDYDPQGTYSPMTEAVTIRIVLALANTLDLELDHLDIKTAFLNASLPEDERFYCSPPEGHDLPDGHAWFMKKALYGAHQSGAVWSKTWRDWMRSHMPNFREAGTERCVYVLRQDAQGNLLDPGMLSGVKLHTGERLVIIVMNTDDLLIAYSKSATSIVDTFERDLNQHFDATPRAPVQQYLGMHITRNRAQHLLTLDGRRHVHAFIEFMGYDPALGHGVRTPLDPNVKFSKDDCPERIDLKLREQVWKAHGKLIHLSVSARPDLAHTVSVLGRYVHNPSEKLWAAYHRVAKYLIRTKDLRLTYGSADSMFDARELYGMSDSDWGGCLDDRRSTGSYLFFLDGAAVSWKVKLSPTTCLSTQEAEYVALSEAVKEALNLRMLLRDLGFASSGPTTLFCDNQGAIFTSRNPTNKPSMRHVDMREHFCRQHVELNNIDPKYCHTDRMTADYLSKQTVCATHERHNARTFGTQTALIPLDSIHSEVAIT